MNDCCPFKIENTWYVGKDGLNKAEYLCTLREDVVTGSYWDCVGEDVCPIMKK